jgi:Phospholipase_D-nuclease N-terminal
MLLLADFTLGNLLVAMLAFYFLFLLVWAFIALFADIFTRHDLSGWGKAGWTLLIVIVPLLGILIYLIARPSDLGQQQPAGGT